MTNEEAAALAPGLYMLTWRSGAESLAAVGRLGSGGSWFAPVTGLPFAPMDVACSGWRAVSSARHLDVEHLAPAAARLDRLRRDVGSALGVEGEPDSVLIQTALEWRGERAGYRELEALRPDHEQARSQVRSVLYTYLSDTELDRALSQNVVDALITAATVRTPPVPTDVPPPRAVDACPRKWWRDARREYLGTAPPTRPARHEGDTEHVNPSDRAREGLKTTTNDVPAVGDRVVAHRYSDGDLEVRLDSGNYRYAHRDRPMTIIGRNTEPLPPQPAATLWDFVRLAAPALGIEPARHVELICNWIEAAAGAPETTEEACRAIGRTKGSPSATVAEHAARAAESFPDLATVITGHRAQETVDDDPAALPDPGSELGIARNRLLTRALEYVGNDSARGRVCRAAIEYAIEHLRAAGEAGTESACILLEQIAEEL
jgi:hypothetical protein